MSKLTVPTCLTLDQARNRLRGAGFWLPRLGVDGVSASGRQNVSVSPHATLADTPGSWTQMIATTTEDICMVALDVQSSGSNTVDSSTIYDLGVGGAGSEVAVISDIPLGYTSLTNGSHPQELAFPIFIPEGSRISVRRRSHVAGGLGLLTRLTVWAVNPDIGMKPASVVDSLSAVTSASRGTVVTAPTVANTKAAWTQLIAATSHEYIALCVGIQGASSVNEVTTTNVALDIGIGTAGNEVIVAPDIFGLINTNEQVHLVSRNIHPCRIPAGVRIAARWAGNNPNVGTTLDVSLHGIRRMAA